jgi:signal transduction histidine kinase
VHARVAAAGGRLVFEVADHGPGVDAADAERIFEPFFTKRTQGTGLGLAVAKRVVELHAGTIAVDAAPGGGARFRVAIPAG